MLKGPNYYGGKSRRAINQFIQDRLPATTDCVYVEPFAGMLGILLNRPKARQEIVNDLAGDIVAFWRGLRDHPGTLKHKVVCSPKSRQQYYECVAGVKAGAYRNDPVQWAWAVWYVLTCGCSKGFNAGYATRFNGAASHFSATFPDEIARLADRIKEVQIENRDALDLLERIAPLSDAVVYADPPYFGAVTSEYMHDDLSLSDFKAALVAQKGFVAVSGYGDTYDDLGWQRHELEVPFGRMGAAAVESTADRKTEVLWTNREVAPPQNELAF